MKMQEDISNKVKSYYIEKSNPLDYFHAHRLLSNSRYVYICVIKVMLVNIDFSLYTKINACCKDL